MKRHRITRKASRRQFRNASHTHRKNNSSGPMRGGIRL